MSLISEALNKVQLQQQSATAFSSYTNHSSRRHQPVVRVKSLTFIWANAAILTVFFVAGLIYLRNRPYPTDATPARSAPLPTAAQPAVAATSPAATPTVASQSTTTSFAAANDTSSASLDSVAYNPPSPSVSADYDLAGMSALGNSTLLSISRRSDHRSIWVQVGKSAGEITAVSYDPETDSAKISVNGRLQTIRMRDGSTPIAAE